MNRQLPIILLCAKKMCSIILIIFVKNKSYNCICAQCNTAFYKSPSKLKSSKSGLVFCKRACKDQAQRIGGITEIQPVHYGTTEHYRTLAFKAYPNFCSMCGYFKHPEVLHIHHKDGDHSNNAIENLCIVCPTCHEETHFLTKTGKWGAKSSGPEGNRTLNF